MHSTYHTLTIITAPNATQLPPNAPPMEPPTLPTPPPSHEPLAAPSLTPGAPKSLTPDAPSALPPSAAATVDALFASSSDSAQELPEWTKGDVLHENIVLFMRDALVLRELKDAIKAGHSGRIIRALKLLALMYRGSGHTKYAHELLHLAHNLAHVWPKPLR